MMLASTGVPPGKDQGSRGERAKNLASDFCEVVRTVQQVGVSQYHQIVHHQAMRFSRTAQQWAQPYTTERCASRGLCSSGGHPSMSSLHREAVHTLHRFVSTSCILIVRAVLRGTELSSPSPPVLHHSLQPCAPDI